MKKELDPFELPSGKEVKAVIDYSKLLPLPGNPIPMEYQHQEPKPILKIWRGK